MMKRQPFSRRVLLCGAGIVALSPLEAMQDVSGHDVSALLDGTGMVRIPPGEFLMGSPNGNADERPVHRVRISQGFEMGKCEVSQAQWEAIMSDAHARPGTKVFNVDGAALSNRPSRFKGASLPVESVSWEDVTLFLKRLNARDTRHAWRLPTEAEWEYACKAGGEPETGLGATAWYKANSGNQTQLVARRRMAGACTICREMWRSGSRIGIARTFMRTVRQPIRRDRKQARRLARTASFAAVAGTIRLRTAGRRFAVSIFPLAGSITSAFAS